MSFGAIAASVGGALAGAGASYGLSQLGGGGEGSSAGYNVQTMPQYSFTEPRLKLASDYVSQNISRMAEGKYPSYWDKLSPLIKGGLQSDLYRTYYGQPGNRTGSIQDAMSIGAMTGLKGKAAGAPANKQLMDYNNKSSSIDQYMASLGLNVMQQGEQTYLQGATSIPTGPNAQIVPWQNSGTSGMDYSGVGSAVGGGVEDMLSAWLKKPTGTSNISMTPGSTGMSGFDWGRTSNYTPYTSGTLASNAASQYGF